MEAIPKLGRWTIDARFNRKALADRILNISRQRERIHITNMDARVFLTECLPGGRDRKRVFAYLDPPYYTNGRRLYMNYYEDEDHRRLACYMQGLGTLKWLMSYDDSQFVEELYTRCVVSIFRSGTLSNGNGKRANFNRTDAPAAS